MRIDPNVVVSPVASPTAERSERREPASPSAPNAVVLLSSAARARNEAGVEPSIAGRLERIRAMIDAGEYPVDLDLLASRIVDDEIARARQAPNEQSEPAKFARQDPEARSSPAGEPAKFARKTP